MSFVSSEYPQIDDYILNDLKIEPEDYNSFNDFLNAVEAEFDKQMSSAVLESANFIWQSREGLEELEEEQQKELERQLEREKEAREREIQREIEREKPKEIKLTENQKTDIKNNDENEDLTKREKTVETVEIVNKEITLQQFYELNPNMVKSTARRELGQAVKRGEIERVSRGVYRKL